MQEPGKEEERRTMPRCLRGLRSAPLLSYLAAGRISVFASPTVLPAHDHLAGHPGALHSCPATTFGGGHLDSGRFSRACRDTL